jgi:Zn-dependent protease with chaperone function
MLGDDERVALLGHELGHLRGRDTRVGLLLDLAHGILTRFATLLAPLPADTYSDFSRHHPTQASSEATMNAAGSMLLRVVSAPAIGVLLSFERLAAVANQRREYVADLRSVDVAGSAASARLMLTLTNIAGLHTLAGAAARRREDPFVALERVRHRPDPTQAQVAATRELARRQDLRWDDSHPRDDLRLALIEARRTERSLPVTAAESGSDRELAGLRKALTRELSDELIETSY